MNGKLLRRKLTTLSNMCKFYWELTIYTFVLCVCSITADPVGEHCAVNIHQIKWYGVLFFQFTHSINGSIILDEFYRAMFFLYRLYHNLAFTPMYVYVLIVSTRGKLLTHKLHSMFLWFSFGYKTRYFLCILRQKRIN
jgi:hypothetical protein